MKLETIVKQIQKQNQVYIRRIILLRSISSLRSCFLFDVVSQTILIKIPFQLLERYLNSCDDSSFLRLTCSTKNNISRH